ncbi:MAG TPA: sulfurtransferase [Burkholderiales bacterium]|nr:sulfurtransferase [Burkholderiales bacterium]
MTQRGPTVSTELLEQNLGSWRIFDCRHDLMQPLLGEQQYREGHIPGAAFAHLDRDLSAPRDGRAGRHPLPFPGDFLAWVGQQGLKPEDAVVCYDAGGGVTAARLWWMLRWIGHEAVAVLEGGYAKWTAEGRPTSTQVPRFEPTSYPMRLRSDLVVGVGVVESAGENAVLVDARAPLRYRGLQEPIDPVAGHIPGAKNRFCNDNLTPQGTFKPAQDLRREFEEVLGGRKPEDVINYCGSGVSACHNILAMELAGLKGSRLYAGSWSDWISDPKRPVGRNGDR